MTHFIGQRIELESRNYNWRTQENEPTGEWQPGTITHFDNGMIHGTLDNGGIFFVRFEEKDILRIVDYEQITASPKVRDEQGRLVEHPAINQLIEILCEVSNNEDDRAKAGELFMALVRASGIE